MKLSPSTSVSFISILATLIVEVPTSSAANKSAFAVGASFTAATTILKVRGVFAPSLSKISNVIESTPLKFSFGVYLISPFESISNVPFSAFPLLEAISIVPSISFTFAIT